MLLSNLNLLATAPGGVAKLRELILTLAVQGKLVPQDPNDEPASVLLKKIRAEKDRLVAQGKIKRDKPLAEITEEEKPFGLPGSWRWARWADIAMKIGDIDHKMPSEVSDGLPYVSPRDFYGENEIDFVGAKKIARSDYLALASKIRPEKGDLIYPRYGTIGVVRMVATDMEFLASYSCAVVKVLRGFLEPNYQYLVSMSDCVKRQAASATNKTTQPNVGLKSIQEYLVPVPPLAEQSRIVTRVEELMRLCDALEAKGQLEATQHAQLVSTLLGTLTESETPEELADNWQRIATHFDLLLDRPEAVDALEQTILQLAVRGLLVPQDPQDEPASELLKKIRVEKDRLISAGKIKRDKPLPSVGEDERPFSLPQGWVWIRLRGLVTHLGDGLHGTPNYSPSGEYFFVNGNNLGEGVVTIKPETKRVDWSEYEKHRKPLDATSVLLSINGTLGRVAFYQDEMIVLGKSACYFNVTVGLQKVFSKLLLECPDFMTYAEKSATGTTIKNLGLKAIGDWPIALPPSAEQSRIVARVAQLRRLCVDLRQRLAASSARQSQLAQSLVEMQSTTTV